MTTFCGPARQTRLELWDVAHHPAQARRVRQGDAARYVAREGSMSVKHRRQSEWPHTTQSGHSDTHDPAPDFDGHNAFRSTV